MASLHDCLSRAVEGGELDPVRAKEAKANFNQLVARYETVMPPHQAAVTAAAHLKEATQRAARSRFHAVVNQLQSMTRLKHQIENAPDPALALRNLLEKSEGSGFTGESVKSVGDALIRSVNAGVHDVLRQTGRNMVGNSRDKILLHDLIRELHLEDTGSSAAKTLAKAVKKQQGRLRQMFNAHGGDIGDLADFGVTHSHDAAAMRKAGYDTWATSVMPRLDWGRIVDFRTGAPFASGGSIPPRADVDAFLKDVWDGIITKGWDDRDPSMAVGGKALYNQRAEARVLHFKSGSDWLEYNREFGTSDPFSAMIGGLHGMARDVAQMRVLGPNPKLGLEYASQVATKRASATGDQKLVDRVTRSGKLAKTMHAHYSGAVNAPVNEAWASFFGGTRKILTAMQLGSAPLSAVTDAATMSVAAQAMGMQGRNVIARSAKLMSSSATRETAARMGYVADTLADAGATAARFTGETMAPELADRLSSITLRASGLSFWTDMNKTAFQMEFAGMLADNADRAFADIDAPLLKLFNDRGITQSDWDHLRDPAGRFTAKNGADFLSPIYWLENQTTMPRAEAEGLAMRVQMAIEEQLEFAVPTANIEAAAWTLGESNTGTFLGELGRSSLMYKSFALSLTLGQYRRFLAIEGTGSRALYAAKISTGLLLTGALAVQLKEIAKGRDPRPMDERKFWLAAFMQGGGVGIFGDFFAAETNRAGGGIAETLAGPVVSLGSSVIKPVASNASRAFGGQDTMLGRDAANFLRYNTPVASSLWPTRVAFDRIVADTVQRFMDPQAEANWRRQERRRERDYGTSTWWKRGEKLPFRTPDLSNVTGADQ